MYETLTKSMAMLTVSTLKSAIQPITPYTSGPNYAAHTNEVEDHAEVNLAWVYQQASDPCP